MSHTGMSTRGRKRDLFALTVGALGVVFGDIGTSPLYTLQTCLSQEYGMPATHANVLGIVSLILWALLLVVAIKYAIFIMRSDNGGEGGILALLALTLQCGRLGNKYRWLFGVLGIFGAALFYGDGMITPAISVLSAVEGLQVSTPSLQPFIIPITIAVLAMLFLIQRSGTARVGVLFGPIMILWFTAIGVLGVTGILRHPTIVRAFDPVWGLDFFAAHRWGAFVILGAVVLAVTGAEALYADMGHFGRKPIRLSWFLFVFPALALNYLGQGALVLADPAAVDNPFFKLVPKWGQLPMVALATVATVIASQAVISGAFSLSRQAVQLRLLPRMAIRHTSAREIGQIYVPFINWTLFVAIIFLVLGFGSSTRLASAYGIAVTGTMVCTTFLALTVARQRWHWRWPAIVVVGCFFLVVDGAFFAANTLKIVQGGWFPLTVGVLTFTLMTTWQKGRGILMERLSAESMQLDFFLGILRDHPPARVQGTAVFLTANLDVVPAALLHNMKHNKVVHERVVMLNIASRDIPRVDTAERLDIKEIAPDFWQVRAWFGFQETPDIPELLQLLAGRGLAFDMMDTSFFLSRETVIPSARGMSLWRAHVFDWMVRNAMSAAKFFGLPMNRVIELGAQIEM